MTTTLKAKLGEALSTLTDCSGDFIIHCSPSTLDDPEAKKFLIGIRKAFDLLNNVRNNYTFEREAI